MAWNICLLRLLKIGGAFYTFIAGAAALPLAESMFNVSWPLLPAAPFSWWQIGGLAVILGGLILYRYATVVRERREKALLLAAAEVDDTTLRTRCCQWW